MSLPWPVWSLPASSPEMFGTCRAAHFHAWGGKFWSFLCCLHDLLPCITQVYLPEMLGRQSFHFSKAADAASQCVSLAAQVRKVQLMLIQQGLFATGPHGVPDTLGNTCRCESYKRSCRQFAWANVLPSAPLHHLLASSGHGKFLQCLHALLRSASDCQRAMQMQEVHVARVATWQESNLPQPMRSVQMAQTPNLQTPMAVLQACMPTAARRTMGLRFPKLVLTASYDFQCPCDPAGELVDDEFAPRVLPAFLRTEPRWHLRSILGFPLGQA